MTHAHPAPSLEELATLGQEKHAASVAAKRQSKSEAKRAQDSRQQNWERSVKRMATYGVRRSLSRLEPWKHLFSAVAILGALFLPFGFTATGSYLWLAAAAVIAAPWAITALHIHRLMKADMAFRAGLPFHYDKYEFILGSGRSYPGSRIKVTFANQAPPKHLLSNVLHALPQPTTIEKVEGKTFTIEVDSNTGSKFDGHRYWYVPWFREFALAMVAIHERYPVESMD
jgi:hypothetical protein